MADGAPQQEKGPLARIPLVLFASLIAGYFITSGSVFSSLDSYHRDGPASCPCELSGGSLLRQEMASRSSAEAVSAQQHKYHALCRACNLAVPPAKVPATPKTSIHVLGERHSGTNAMEQLLGLNFDVRVRANFTTHKHFMQPYPRHPADYSRHLIVLSVLNPYDWVVAMRRECYHCEAMEALALPEFLAAPMASHPVDMDLLTPLAGTANTSQLQGMLLWERLEDEEEAEGSGVQDIGGQQPGVGEAVKRYKGPTTYVLQNGTRVRLAPFSDVMAMRRLKICQVLDLALRFSIDLEIVRLEDFLYPHHQIELMRSLHYTYRLPVRPAAETWNATTDALAEGGARGEGGAGGAEEGDGGEGGTAAAGGNSLESSGNGGGGGGGGGAQSSGDSGGGVGSGGGGGGASRRRLESEGGSGEEEQKLLIQPLKLQSKARRRKRKFRPQRKLALSLYYRGTLDALSESDRGAVGAINSALDWQLEQALGYTPIT